MIINNKKFNAGFTLVETLVALSIFGISIVGLISATASGVANTNFAKNKLTASYLAQEGVELVRNIRDSSMLTDGASGWAIFTAAVSACNATFGCTVEPKTLVVSQCSAGCPKMSQDSDGSFGYIGAESLFKRTITVVSDPSNPVEEKITSTVSWTQGSTTRFVTYSENLFDWITSTQ